MTRHVWWLYFTLALFVFYTLAYLAQPALPGGDKYPLGWWGWFDQGQYINSVRAISNWTFNPGDYFYPPGYPALGAAFYKLMPIHPFYVVNILSFLGTATCYVLITERYLGRNIAAFSFIAVHIIHFEIMRQYLIPWTTIPVTFFLYLVIWLIQRRIFNYPSLMAIGLFTGAIIPFRPADVLILLPFFIYLPFVIFKELESTDCTKPYMLVSKKMTVCCSAALIGLTAFLYFNYQVYGNLLGSYFDVSAKNGFFIPDITEKYVSTFLDSLALYGEKGNSLLERLPWLFFTVIGLVVVLLERKYFLLALVGGVSINLLVYLPYSDLLPLGIWRYFNIHYFTWFIPFALMFALYPLLNWAKQNKNHFLIATAMSVIITGFGINVNDNAEGSTTEIMNDHFTVQYESPTELDGVNLLGVNGEWTDLYFSPIDILVDGKNLKNISEYRVFPIEGGARILFIRPLIVSSINVKKTSYMSTLAEQQQIQPIIYSYDWGRFPWLTGIESKKYRFYPDGKKVIFSDSSTSNLYTAYGFSSAEEWGRWTEGEEAILRASISREMRKTLNITLVVVPFLWTEHNELSFDFWVNEIEVDSRTVRSKEDLVLEYRLEDVEEELEFKFIIHSPRSPKELGLNDDSRRLGLGLKSMRLSSD